MGPAETICGKCERGHGVGLANTRERLRVLYGDAQEFRTANRDPRGFEVFVRLPFERAPATEETSMRA